jgi:hypothetical protein
MSYKYLTIQIMVSWRMVQVCFPCNGGCNRKPACEKEYHIIWLTARIVELIFNFRDGLDEESLNILHRLCLRRLVLLEEWVVPEQCVITCHNTIHIRDDILRFGHSDNYWCFPFERTIMRYSVFSFYLLLDKKNKGV